MASTLIELAAEIVSAHASRTEMSLEQLNVEIKMVHSTLKTLEQMESEDSTSSSTMTIKQAFKKDQVACMICGQTGFKTLKRHLMVAHDMKPGQYRKQFNIPTEMPLAAKDYVEKRRQMALDKGLAENLAKARNAKKKAAKTSKTKK